MSKNLFWILILGFIILSGCIKKYPVNAKFESIEEWRLLGLENETVTAIAVDPVHSNIIYAGTLYDYSAGKSGYLFKSTDSGATWDTLLVGGGYRAILIDPSNHNTIYALPGAILKSEDGGQTWEMVIDGIDLDFETRLMSLAMNPKNSNVLYAGTGGFFGGDFYKSSDGGLHWNKTPTDSLRDGVVSIAIDPVDTSIVYAGTAWRGILWKSIDAGNTWFRTGLGETGLPIYDILVKTDISICTIYVGVSRSGILKTENGGISWENFSQGLPENCSVMKIQESNSSRLFIVGSSINGSGIYEYLHQKNEWNKVGIDTLANEYYYYSDLQIISTPAKLYFGGKGIYVRNLNK